MLPLAAPSYGTGGAHGGTLGTPTLLNDSSPNPTSAATSGSGSITWPALPSGSSLSGSINTGTYSVAPLSNPTPAAAPAPAPAPSASSATPAPSAATDPNSGALLNGVSTQIDPNSPTGGYVNVNTNVGAGVDTSANSLLPGGFQQSQLGVQAPSSSTPDPSTYVSAAQAQTTGPTAWNVTPNQTVAGQYASLMGEGGGAISPAVQAAEQAVLRSNAAHGGANDLMAQTAATQAGSNVALTVAQQDAQVNAAAGQYNATQANSFATQMNTLVDNAQLSRQNFDQALGTLNAQTSQQLQLLTANINANAAETSTSLKAAIDQAQVSLNSTLAQMGQSYNYSTAEQLNAAGIQNSQAWTNYGMQVRLNYLSGVSTQMNALQQEIANISANPNITSAQAQGAMTDAVNEYNTLVAQMGSYSSAMMPVGGTGATYNSPSYNYSVVDSTSWPGTGVSTSGTGGGSASNGFFLNPSALNAQPTSVAPATNPASAASAATGTPASAGGGSGEGTLMSAVTSGNAASFNNAMSTAGFSIANGNITLNGQSIGSQQQLSNDLSSSNSSGSIQGILQDYAGWANAHPVLSTIVNSIVGNVIPGAGLLASIFKMIGNHYINKADRQIAGKVGSENWGTPPQNVYTSNTPIIGPAEGGGGTPVNPTVTIGPMQSGALGDLSNSDAMAGSGLGNWDGSFDGSAWGDTGGGGSGGGGLNWLTGGTSSAETQ